MLVGSKLAREMEQLNPQSVLVTGANRGLGLELVKQLGEKTDPPRWIFATCRDPVGPRGQVRHEVPAVLVGRTKNFFLSRQSICLLGGHGGNMIELGIMEIKTLYKLKLAIVELFL